MRNRVLLPALLALIAVSLSCATTRVEGQNVGECTDGADNDEDGLFDCVDPDCMPAPACAGDDDDDTTDPGDDDTNPPGDDDTNHGDDDDPGPGDDDSGGLGDDDSSGPGDDDDTANLGENQNPGDCGDGLDNDSDGLTDCEDPDCGGDPGVPPAPECDGGDDDSSVGDDDDSAAGDDDSSIGPAVEDCDNFIDDDNDGDVDCDDADCTGEPNCGSTFAGVEIGSMGPCVIVASATSECVLPLGDPLCASVGNCSSSMTYIALYDIQEIAFTLNVTHPALGELSVSVVDHGGQQEVTLFSDGALTGAHFVDTVFLNCANTTNCLDISQGTAPYTGDHAPETALSPFDGLDINGNWTLRVLNTGSTTGTVETWSIGAVLQ
jgi:hypothetical protein